MGQKSTLISGKLTGTRTLFSDLEEVENPDEVELFLKDFLEIKFSISNDNNLIFVQTEEEFKKAISELKEDNEVSLFLDSSMTKLFVTTGDKTTYVMSIHESSVSHISLLLSAEKPVKYILNGFSFVKWCNAKEMEIKNLFDILVYMKLLTNMVDPSLNVEDYMKKYIKLSSGEEELSFQSEMVKGNFILAFGKYLAESAQKLGLSSVNKMINENSYFEGRGKEEKNEDNVCQITCSYIDLEKFIEENKREYVAKFHDRAYMKSPLGRIATKFGNKELELVEEFFRDDLEMKILNELFNNNMKVNFLNDNLYEVTCKYKNIGSVVSLVTAILKDTFYTLFERKIDVKLECIVKE